MPAGFKLTPMLPEGVAELLALTKYHVDYAAPRYEKGALLAGTGGYRLFNADGTPASTVIPSDASLDHWRIVIGQTLDADLRWKEHRTAELFRDPYGFKDPQAAAVAFVKSIQRQHKPGEK